MAAVRNLHIEFGIMKSWILECSFLSPGLCIHTFLYKTLRGIKSSLGISKRARYPITISILSEIYAKLKPLHSFDVDSSMLWAAFTLAFSGFLQSSEFTCNGRFDFQSHLTRSDVSFDLTFSVQSISLSPLKNLRPTPSGRQPSSP